VLVVYAHVWSVPVCESMCVCEGMCVCLCTRACLNVCARARAISVVHLHANLH